MRFKSFHIQNFKGIKDLTLPLENVGSIYTLIGLNESGKTSILEAIHLFSNGIVTSERHKYIPKSEKYSFDGEIRISAMVEFSEEDKKSADAFLSELGYVDFKYNLTFRISHVYNFEKSIPTNQDNYWKIGLTGRKDANEDFYDVHDKEFDNWNAFLDYIKEELFPKIVYYPNFLFDFPEKIYLERPGLDNKEFDEYKDIIQDILYTVKPDLTVESDILNNMKTSSARNNEVLDLLLDKMGFSVSNIVFSAWEKLFSRGNKEIIIKPGKDHINGNTHYYLQFKLKEGANQFFISERSLGFKWFFTFLLFTGLRKNRVSEKSEVLFLLDEPASNLHPTAQRNLLGTFQEIATKCSLIYTTHSHYLINPEWLKGAFIVRNKAINYKNIESLDSSDTDIEISPYSQFVAKYPNQKEYFQPILDTLDYQPGLLEKIPSIVIVEGKNDFYTFLYVSKFYFEGTYDLHFYPAGGANSDEHIIRMYIAWGRDFLVLRDADSAGKKAISSYKKLLPLFLENRAFTFDDISTDFNGFALEDFFSKEDQIKVIRHLDEASNAFDKSRFNLAIQFLLLNKIKLQLSTETLARFQATFEFLQKHL